jgi:hypothetical protein
MSAHMHSDEKLPMVEAAPAPSRQKAGRTMNFTCATVAGIVLFFVLCRHGFPFSEEPVPLDGADATKTPFVGSSSNKPYIYMSQQKPIDDPVKEMAEELVPLEAHIMSKCPDAKVGS